MNAKSAEILALLGLAALDRGRISLAKCQWVVLAIQQVPISAMAFRSAHPIKNAKSRWVGPVLQRAQTYALAIASAPTRSYARFPLAALVIRLGLIIAKATIFAAQILMARALAALPKVEHAIRPITNVQVGSLARR